MGALHFLEHEFHLADLEDKAVHHTLELYETGGELFLRLWQGGRGRGKAIICKMTQAQAKELAEGAEGLSTRIGF